MCMPTDSYRASYPTIQQPTSKCTRRLSLKIGWILRAMCNQNVGEINATFQKLLSRSCTQIIGNEIKNHPYMRTFMLTSPLSTILSNLDMLRPPDHDGEDYMVSVHEDCKRRQNWIRVLDLATGDVKAKE